MSNRDDMAAVLRDPELQALAWERHGRPLLDCSPLQAVALLREIAERHERESVRLTAGIDQAEALVADARRCGCRSVLAELGPDGNPELSTGRIVHTCGRSA